MAGRLECIANMLDFRGKPVVGPDDRHDVESAPLFEQVVMPQKLERGHAETPLLLRGDCLGGNASASRLDLNEDQRVGLARNQINFTPSRAISAIQDAYTVAAQITSGG